VDVLDCVRSGLSATAACAEEGVGELPSVAPGIDVTFDPPPCFDVKAGLSWQPEFDVRMIDPDTGKVD
jgi:hypothetical protein